MVRSTTRSMVTRLLCAKPKKSGRRMSSGGPTIAKASSTAAMRSRDWATPQRPVRCARAVKAVRTAPRYLHRHRQVEPLGSEATSQSGWMSTREQSCRDPRGTRFRLRVRRTTPGRASTSAPHGRRAGTGPCRSRSRRSALPGARRPAAGSSPGRGQTGRSRPRT